MCSCHSILECCVTFSGVKLSIRSFVLFWKEVYAGKKSSFSRTEKSYVGYYLGPNL